MKHKWIGFGLSVILLSLSGCGIFSAPGEFQGSIPPGEAYNSVQDFSEAADLVVRGKAGTSDITKIEGMAFTLTTFKVIESLKGKSAESITIRQVGSKRDNIDFLAPVLDWGKEYILFLDEFEFERGNPIPGEYVVLGFGALERHGNHFVTAANAKNYDISINLTIDEARASLAPSIASIPVD